MSADAGDPKERLARSRRAIVQYLEGREKGQHHDEPDDGQPQGEPGEQADGAGNARRQRGWLGSVKHGVKTWWRYHPAHMALEVATPALETLTRDKPVAVLAVAAATGAALVVLRPWRLISVTTVLLALVKSSQLSSVLLSAMSAADGWQSEAKAKIKAKT